MNFKKMVLLLFMFLNSFCIERTYAIEKEVNSDIEILQRQLALIDRAMSYTIPIDKARFKYLRKVVRELIQLIDSKSSSHNDSILKQYEYFIRLRASRKLIDDLAEGCLEADMKELNKSVLDYTLSKGFKKIRNLANITASTFNHINTLLNTLLKMDVDDTFRSEIGKLVVINGILTANAEYDGDTRSVLDQGEIAYWKYFKLYPLFTSLHETSYGPLIVQIQAELNFYKDYADIKDVVGF